MILTPTARRDIDDAIVRLELPGNSRLRISRSLRVLETFPMAGRALPGRWAPARFVVGPWTWMILLYTYDETTDEVYIVAVHDARTATSPRA